MSQDKLKSMLASYGRSVVGAGVALYSAGVTDPKDLVYALFGALVPVVARYVNPNDPAFGRVPSVEEVDSALKKAKKAPAKKAVKK
jgi:hypothetical protein